MKRKPTLKKYPTGGTTTPAPAPKKQYSMDEYNKLLGNYQTINPTDPQSGKDVKDYVGNFITPTIKNYQGQLNTALRSKYKLGANDPITNQYLSPEEADKALNGKYSDYMTNFDAYQNYRAKTPQMPERTVEGTETVDPKVYGRRHVNLFQPYKVNTETPNFGYGGKKLPRLANGATFNPADPNRSSPQDYQDEVAQEQGMNHSIDASAIQGSQMLAQGSGDTAKIGAGMGWLGYATAAEGMGKSMIKKDEFGNPATKTGRAANEIITPDHEQMINDVKRGQYGTALLDSTGLGKFGRMASELTGHGNDRSNDFWGKANKFMGTPQYDDQGRNMNTSSGLFPYGGIQNGNPNAEVEKQEVVQTPDGSAEAVDGPSHEQGGVPVNIPDQTRIFSDRLKLPGSKKTIAEEAAKFTTKREDKTLADNSASKVARATAKLVSQVKQQKLDQLFQVQESLKQSKVAAYAQKMGVTFPQNQGQRFPNGGTKEYPKISNADAIEQAKRLSSSYPSNMNLEDFNKLNSTDKERVQNLYKTLNQGTKFPNFNYGLKNATDSTEYLSGYNKPYFGEKPNREQFLGTLESEMNHPEYMDVKGSLEKWKNTNSEPDTKLYYANGGTKINDNFYNKERRRRNMFPGGGTYDANGNLLNGMPAIDVPQDPSFNPQGSYKNSPGNDTINDRLGYHNAEHTNNIDWRNIAENGASVLAQNAGNIWDLYKSGAGKKYDKENYGNVTPTYLDDKQALTDADIQAHMTRENIKGAVNGNVGAYLNNVIQAGSENTLNKARIREDYQNKNAEIANYSKYYNKGNEIAAKTATEQNKARSEDMAAHAIRDIGSKTASGYADYKANEMDDKKMAIINQYFPNYKFDPNTYDMYYKAATSGNVRSKKPKARAMANSGTGYNQ